jgi:hypothetical protein
MFIAHGVRVRGRHRREKGWRERGREKGGYLERSR